MSFDEALRLLSVVRARDPADLRGPCPVLYDAEGEPLARQMLMYENEVTSDEEVRAVGDQVDGREVCGDFANMGTAAPLWQAYGRVASHSYEFLGTFLRRALWVSVEWHQTIDLDRLRWAYWGVALQRGEKNTVLGSVSLVTQEYLQRVTPAPRP